MQSRTIGDRIQLLSDENQIELSISQKVERWKESLLLAWLLAWIFCGAVFIYYFLNETDSGNKTFIGISIVFWAYFLLRMGKIALWRLKGREIIKIKDGQLSVQNAFGNKGKIQKFKTRNITRLGLINKSDRNFMSFMDKSSWSMGGETIGFEYMNRKYQLGKQLENKESRAVLQVIEKQLRKKVNK